MPPRSFSLRAVILGGDSGTPSTTTDSASTDKGGGTVDLETQRAIQRPACDCLRRWPPGPPALHTGQSAPPTAPAAAAVEVAVGRDGRRHGGLDGATTPARGL